MYKDLAGKKLALVLICMCTDFVIPRIHARLVYLSRRTRRGTRSVGLLLVLVVFADAAAEPGLCRLPAETKKQSRRPICP